MKLLPNSDAESVKLIETTFKSFGAYAPGWSAGKVAGRLCDIKVFFISNSDAAIPLSRRRRIERTAKKLWEELDGLGGLHGEFLDTLHTLAGAEMARSKPEGIRSQHGGDRRSGEHTLKGSVLRMLIHLYMSAHAKPGFARNGPLVRFANAGGELILGQSKPFTSEAVAAEWQRMQKAAPKRPSLRTIYRSESYVSGRSKLEMTTSTPVINDS